MFTLLSFLILLAALVTLIALSVIDLRTLLLPNKGVASFAALGVAFHFSVYGLGLGWADMGLGALMGGGILLAIRTISNYFYEEDALGLGDVKLLAAAGIWLGPHHVLLALILGALAGIAHGVIIMLYAKLRAQSTTSIKDFSLPAGPGFAVGIVVAIIYSLKDLI